MTISDTDLEARLRDLRLRADQIPPPPFELAERTRERHRVERRRRLQLSAAGLAAVLLFVGVPVVASGLVGNSNSTDAARPAPRTFVPTPSLFDLPTRGSLADEQEWLTAVAALSWLPDEELPPEVEWPDPPLEDRKIAFAGDTPDGRVALVLGREGATLHHTWFMGSRGAGPDQMTLVGSPAPTPGGRAASLLDVPDAAADRALLVVVTFPGDRVGLLTGHTLTEEGETQETWQALPAEDGVTVASVARPYGPLFLNGVELSGGGRGTDRVFPDLTARADVAARIPIDVADPRGLRSGVPESELQWLLQSVVSYFGLSPDRISPTLLAVGPLQDATGNTAVLIGVTLPSGATAAGWLTYRGDPNSAEGSTSTSGVTASTGAAGTPLLDQVIAVPAAGTWALVVSGPSSGVAAQILDETGAVLATIPLVDGAGSGPHAPRLARSVRILDASGDVVAQAPVLDR